jgi:hypothetical protein
MACSSTFPNAPLFSLIYAGQCTHNAYCPYCNLPNCLAFAAYSMAKNGIHKPKYMHTYYTNRMCIMLITPAPSILLASPHSSPPNIDLVCEFVPVFPPLGRRPWLRSVRASRYNTRGRSCPTYSHPNYYLYTLIRVTCPYLSPPPLALSSLRLLSNNTFVKTIPRGLQVQ